MLAYFIYFLTVLFYLGLLMINLSKPSLTGENAMGYGLALFGLGIGFAISSLILTIAIAYKDGFDWIRNSRILIVGLAWLCITSATLACTIFKWEWHEGEFPPFLRWIALTHGQIWLPILMLLPYLFILNENWRLALPSLIYKLPLILCFGIAAIMSVGLLYGWLNSTIKLQREAISLQVAKEDTQHNNYLQQIAAHEITDPILPILALTGKYHDNDVRESAVAKIKEHPEWETELIQLLQSDTYYYEVYTFLDGNKIDHPEIFFKPIVQSIQKMADDIRKSITDSNNLQDWHFEHFGIDRLLRAIDMQFSNHTSDFRPSIIELQSALNTTKPDRFKNVNFNVATVINDWLKKKK